MKEIAEFHRAVSHPTRIGIVKVLGERGFSSFTEIKKALNIGDAKLYYHLTILKNFVAQDAELKYFLTEQGRQAFNILFSDDGKEMDTFNIVAKGGWVGNFYHYLSVFFLPKWLILYLFRSPLRNAVELSAGIFLGSWMASISGLKITLLLIDYDPGHPQSFLFIEFVLSWFLVYGLTALISLIFKGKGNNLNLFVGVTFSRVPLIIFSLFWMLDRTFQLGVAFLYDGFLIRVLVILSQAWSLSLLTLVLSLTKRFSLERAAVATLIITYLNLAYQLATQKF